MFDTDIKSLKSLNHYLQELVEDRLWLKVIIALFLGVGLGLLLSPQNGWITKATADVLGNWLALPGMLFLKLVQMIMIPLIVASIITGIASNDKENLKKLGGGVLLYFISTTIISVTIGTILGLIFSPGKYLHQEAVVDHEQALVKTSESTEFSLGIIDIPNAFIQTHVENEQKMIIINLREVLVNILVMIVPEIYTECVTENKKNIKHLLIQCLNTLYSTMVASLLYYKKFADFFKILNLSLIRTIHV